MALGYGRGPVLELRRRDSDWGIEACPSVASPEPYGVGDGLAEAGALADAPADPVAEAAADAEPLADALAEAEGATLGRGAGVGEGKSVVGTFASESAKIRMKITNTITTHGLASESERGGRAPL
jgi:hypothetical protein